MRNNVNSSLHFLEFCLKETKKMEIKILTATENETVLFATEELTRYLYMIDKSLKIEVERHSF